MCKLTPTTEGAALHHAVDPAYTEHGESEQGYLEDSDRETSSLNWDLGTLRPVYLTN